MVSKMSIPATALVLRSQVFFIETGEVQRDEDGHILALYKSYHDSHSDHALPHKGVNSLTSLLASKIM
jgi:hypothetical protein